MKIAKRKPQTPQPVKMADGSWFVPSRRCSSTINNKISSSFKGVKK